MSERLLFIAITFFYKIFTKVFIKTIAFINIYNELYIMLNGKTNIKMRKTISQSEQVAFSKVKLGLDSEEYFGEYVGLKLGHRILNWEYVINGKKYLVKSHTTFKKANKRSNSHVVNSTKLIYNGIECDDNDKKLVNLILKSEN